MRLMRSKAISWLTVGLRLTLLTVTALWLFASPAPARSGWPPPVKVPFMAATSLPLAVPVPDPARHSSGDSRGASPSVLKEPQMVLLTDIFRPADLVPPSSGPPAPPPFAGIYQGAAAAPGAKGWQPTRTLWPLQPASAFAGDTSPGKYLDTWPTLGTSGSEEWPEYIPEGGGGRD